MKKALALIFLLLAAFAVNAQSKGPAIELREVYYDFGDIEQGVVVEHVFEVANTGDSALVLQKVFSTCGCTIPAWSKDPIAPGEKGKITVKYNSDGKMGLQNKIVTVFSNARNVPEEVPTRVSIRVNVIPKK